MPHHDALPSRRWEVNRKAAQARLIWLSLILHIAIVITIRTRVSRHSPLRLVNNSTCFYSDGCDFWATTSSSQSCWGLENKEASTALYTLPAPTTPQCAPLCQRLADTPAFQKAGVSASERWHYRFPSHCPGLRASSKHFSIQVSKIVRCSLLQHAPTIVKGAINWRLQ